MWLFIVDFTVVGTHVLLSLDFTESLCLILITPFIPKLTVVRGGTLQSLTSSSSKEDDVCLAIKLSDDLHLRFTFSNFQQVRPFVPPHYIY